MSIAGRKSTSLDHGNEVPNLEPSYSFDSDWGPLEGVNSRDESFDDSLINTNGKTSGRKYPKFGSKMFRMMSEGSTASSVSECDVTDQYSPSLLAEDDSDDDNDSANDETKPLNGRLATDRANSKLLRNAVKKQLELNRFQNSEFKKLQKRKSKAIFANVRILVFPGGKNRDFSEVVAKKLVDQLNFKSPMETLAPQNMDELQSRKRLFGAKKELANFFHADIFNVSSESMENGCNGTTPVLGHQDAKCNGDMKHLPEAVKFLMEDDDDDGDHSLNSGITDLRLKWLMSELNNECKQFQHMIYPFLCMWVHDDDALHADCGSILAFLKELSWSNNATKVGIIRRLIFGEPIDPEVYQIVDDKKNAVKTKKNGKTVPVATVKQLEHSRSVDCLLRMPEILIVGPNVELIMYCKTCAEVQKLVIEKGLKLNFCKDRDEVLPLLLERPLLKENVFQGALVAFNLIMCGLYEGVQGMEGSTGFSSGQPDDEKLETEYLSE